MRLEVAVPRTSALVAAPLQMKRHAAGFVKPSVCNLARRFRRMSGEG